MRVGVVGTGYVGLVSGTCFAEMGNTVTCVDIDEAKVAKLASGQVTIFEPGLEVYFERNLKQGNLHFTTDLKEAVVNSDILFLALPTPPQEDGSADLSYVLEVARDVAALMADMPDAYRVIVNKSTVPRRHGRSCARRSARGRARLEAVRRRLQPGVLARRRSRRGLYEAGPRRHRNRQRKRRAI